MQADEPGGFRGALFGFENFRARVVERCCTSGEARASVRLTSAAEDGERSHPE
jgi:hypothetical protein